MENSSPASEGAGRPHSPRRRVDGASGRLEHKKPAGNRMVLQHGQKSAFMTRRDEILNEWAGPWVTNPKSDEDRAASSLAKSAIKFTKADSLISPVVVAAIDILGMKALLKTKPLEEIAERFAEPFYNLDGPAYRAGLPPFSGEQLERMGYRPGAAIYSVVISDTILLVRRPDWENTSLFSRAHLTNGTVAIDAAIAEADAVVWLAQCVSKVIRINSFYGIRLRSAISFGDCIVSVRGGPACLGEPSAEASRWERQQEWIGGMLTPSAIAALRRGAKAAKQLNGADFQPEYANFLVQYAIPLKPGCEALSEPQIALNWIKGLIPGAMWKANMPTEEDDAPEDVKRKVANTISFAKHCENTGFDTTIDWDIG